MKTGTFTWDTLFGDEVGVAEGLDRLPVDFLERQAFQGRVAPGRPT
jgi:hypothetical protein